MSHIILTDERIRELISEPKDVPEGLGSLGRPMPERNGHRHKEFDVATNSENLFFVKLRQLCANPLNFSVILAYQLPGLHTLIRLRRYNGKHHHTNHLERQGFYGFHIHTATQRYQTAGFRPDHFAEMTNRYWDLDSAIRCLVGDCGFKSPLDDSPLFRSKP